MWYLALKLVDDGTYASQIRSFEFVSRAFFLSLL
jgi:hypothetical protein